MLEKYKKQIGVLMLGLVALGIIEAYLIKGYILSPDLPASFERIVPSMEIPASLASSGIVTNF